MLILMLFPPLKVFHNNTNYQFQGAVESSGHIVRVFMD